MKHISKDAYIDTSSSLVLTLSNEAREKKAKGIKVIDATIGMLLDDEGKLSSFPLMNKALKDAVTLDNRKYSTVRGNALFHKNLINWIFKENPKGINKYEYAVCASMGGSGALTLAVRNYVDKSKELLIPDIGWGNYSALAVECGRTLEKYPLFKNNKLDINGIKESILKSAKKYKRVTLIINDPCHNPSGYSLTKKEWEELVNFFNKVNKQYPLTLILDVAYMDYSHDSRIYFKTIEKIKAQYLTLVAFSASKTLSVYGMRLGALIALGNKEDIEDFKLCSAATSRAIWSSPSAYLISAFNIALGDKKVYPAFEKYRLSQTKLLENRFKQTRKFFDKLINSETLPYKEGFFLTYKVKNANKLADSLKKKNIYVLPMQDKYIRIAICSLTNLK